MNNLLDKLKYLVNSLDEDLTKFYKKGNHAASIRARKTLQDIKSQSQLIRDDISQTRKTNKK